MANVIPIMSESRLQLQKEFIQAKLRSGKCTIFNKYGLTLIDSNDVILSSLNGELRNMILAFFKGGLYAIKKCEHCGTTAGSQYERAHCKDVSRLDVAHMALSRIRPDGSAPIKQNDFMRAFIEEHCNVPLWLLCKPCHIKYDKACKAEDV